MDNKAPFLAGGGEMGERIRAMDWTRTPLGPPDRWPQSLRSAVSILLPSKAQIILFWGPDLVTLYNDAYRPVFGAKHPDALGLPAREAWSEIWKSGLQDLLGGVVETGEAYWATNRLFHLRRFGFVEETYFDVSYDPVRDESGKVGGVFCIVSETTERVLGERRLRTLRELSTAAAGANSAETACALAVATLAEHPEDLPFSLLYLMDGSGRRATLAGASGLTPGGAASPLSIDLEDESAVWPLRRVRETGRAVELVELETRLGPLPGGAWPEPAHTALVLPMKKAGQEWLSGYIVAGVSPRLRLDDAYRGFLDLLAGQAGVAVGNARAYEEEKKRAEELAELDRVKTVFFSNVSHEFRTPLTLMMGPVGDLLAKSHTDLSPSAADQLELVNRNGMRLMRLVNTLLDFSRIEAGRVRAVYQPTDLSAFTADLASVFRTTIERAGLKLTVDCPRLPEPVYVDRDMWEKIVLNLLSNAFKFTFEGEISVTVGLARSQREKTGASADSDAMDAARRREGVILQVRDTGTGISKKEMPRLFERFHRVQNARGRTHEGSGIGLALVQELVKLHGGSIRAESAPGQGTTFTITLPLGSAHLPPDQIGKERSRASTILGAEPFVEEAIRWLPGEDSGPGSEVPIYAEPLPVPAPGTGLDQADERPRILVADDNADMRVYLARLLSERYRIQTVPDGEAALEAVRAQSPDLVLTDVMMPNLDGFGLLRELRAGDSTREIPVIMLSARAGEESRVEGMEVGADDYLIKPFSARELLARVGAHLQMAHMRRDANEALRRRGEQFMTLLDQAPLGVYLVDADFRIREINPIAALAFERVPGGALGRDFHEVLHLLLDSGYANEIERIFRHTLETGEPYVASERARFRDNREAPEYFEWRADRIPLPEGRHGVVCYFREITAHVTARKQLELSETALREADRRKDEFLAMLAHELRGPLAPLGNMLEILKRADGDLDLLRQARETMERQFGQLVRLVDDLLDVGRITSNRLELRKERIELAPILREVVETAGPMAEVFQHEVTLELPPDPVHVNADPVRLAQVFHNLLHNACKYTPPKGRIRITAERRADEVEVRVEDNGLGISADELAKVFDMFVQVDRSLERSQGGLGIGLTLVKRLVQLHGGTVEAQSEGLGRGSTLIVRIPVAAQLKPDLRLQSAREPAVVARRFLVVDDNIDSAESLTTLLSITGNETRMAHDGLQAVEAAEQFRPEVVLLDIGLPKLNGLAAARRIREQPWGKDMVLIALTGWGQQENRRHSQEAGFDAHLTKPVDLDALMKLLATLPAE